jgi:hypothetical protein
VAAIKRTKHAVERVIAALARMDKPFTFIELCAAANVEHTNMRNKIKKQWLAEGMFHLVGWADPPFGRKPALYMRGPATAPIPVKPKFCRIKAASEWKKKHRWSELQSAQRRADRRVQRLARAPSPLVGLLEMRT